MIGHYAVSKVNAWLPWDEFASGVNLPIAQHVQGMVGTLEVNTLEVNTLESIRWK